MVHGTQTVVSLVGNQNQEPVVMGVCNLNSVEIQPRFVRFVLHLDLSFNCTQLVCIPGESSISYVSFDFLSTQWSTARGRGPGNMKPIPVVPLPEELGGVLHPSNKNKPVKFRNLFTSTPIGANSTTA